jgi:hypothetical protein
VRSILTGLPDGKPLLRAALEYATRGWHVFPCRPRSKEPAIARGFYSATTNPETIKQFWGDPDFNIGVRTGAVSGFWVLDIDGDNGKASLNVLQAKHGRLPATREVIAPRGRHLLFRCTGEMKSTTGKIAAGIDTRADGGYVLAPPSIHPNGDRYAWRDDSIAIATAPDWLLAALRKPIPLPTSARALSLVHRPGSYGRAALEREYKSLAAMAPDTGRNNALNLTAFRLGQLVAGGELDRGDVIRHLLHASTRNQLVADTGQRGVLATIYSGLNAGMKSPRRRAS